MAAVVKVKDIVDALELVHDGMQSYLNIETGQVIQVADEYLDAAESGASLENYADWEQDLIREAQDVLQVPEKYVTLPDRFDINEYSLMEQFCCDLEDDTLSNTMLMIIKGSGAFRRFHGAIAQFDIANDWYQFKGKAFQEMAIDWLEAHEIKYQQSEG
ncbi:MAG: UPF0158 family protein [Oculatellaceae cyanobacterium Prado106]|jgi:hypothetical protein|nr:UPF0158 family protein [Oculatellaceae cyanobacterium Prado106]